VSGNCGPVNDETVFIEPNTHQPGTDHPMFIRT
jgi:hypothetical protein